MHPIHHLIQYQHVHNYHSEFDDNCIPFACFYSTQWHLSPSLPLSVPTRAGLCGSFPDPGVPYLIPESWGDLEVTQ